MPLMAAQNTRNCPETLKRPVWPCAAQAALERGHRAGRRVRGAVKRDLKAFKRQCRLVHAINCLTGGAVITRDDLKSYEGREHAKAKHLLLESYWQRYLMILASKGVQKLAFVDCFAGPWQSQCPNLSDTSFGISLAAIKRCSDALSKKGPRPVIRAMWIEQDEHAFERLSVAAKEGTDFRVSVEARKGRFQDNIEAIARFVGSDSYAFIFVDPKGYSGLIEADVLAPLLQLPRCELLINYMWDHIKYAFGHSHHPGHQDNLRRLYGDAADALMALPDSSQRESECIQAYENMLRATCGTSGRERLRVLSYPIRSTHGQQYPKYYLVHSTHAPRGLITFAEQCDKTDPAQGLIFQIAEQTRRDAKRGITDLFANEPPQPLSSSAEANSAVWLDRLDAVGIELKVGTEVWADLLERGRCLPSALQEGARQLLLDGIIENVSAPNAAKTRRTSPVNVKNDGGDLLRRLR